MVKMTGLVVVINVRKLENDGCGGSSQYGENDRFGGCGQHCKNDGYGGWD